MMLFKTSKSLAFKTTLLFLAIALLPYILGTLLITTNSEKLLHANIVKGLKKEADVLRDNIDARLFNMRSNATAWAGLEVAQDILIDDVDKRIAHTFEELKKNYGLSGTLYAVKKNGVIIASSNSRHMGKKISPLWFSRILTGETVDIDIHLSAISGGRVIAFGIPVRMRKEGNKIIGAILVEYGMDNIKGLTHHDAAIIDSKGKIIKASGAFPLGENAPFSIAFEKEGVGNVSEHIVAISISKEYYDFKGFGWRIALAEKKTTALEPIIMAEQATIKIGLLGLILIFGLVPFFVERSIRPIKELSRTAEEIAKTKNLSLRVESSTGDEVGKLADAFNYMIEEVNSHINQIRDLEEQMRRADRLSALGELSAGMAHEIKNPLGIIRSSADILKGRLENNPSSMALSLAISEEAVRLDGILDAFLQFARPRPPRPEPCSINAVIDRVVKLLGPHFIKTRINLELNQDEDLPSIQADADQLHQVFVNLLINSLQAMPEGGRLLITTRQIVKDGPAGGKMAEVIISDSGTGIPDENIDKIFNPFFTTKEKGSGLGLSIVHRIIEGHKGNITVEKGVPHGTIFKIDLPFSNQ